MVQKEKVPLVFADEEFTEAMEEILREDMALLEELAKI